MDILDAIAGAKRSAARDSMRAHLRQVLDAMTGVEKKEPAGL
jgi:DNA-binding GntR family transcriptional regulator